MKAIIIVNSLLFILLSHIIHAYSGQIDSLKAIEPNTRFEHYQKYVQLASAYNRKNYDSLYYFLHLARQYTDSSHHEIKLNNIKASANFYQGAFDSAHYYWNKNLLRVIKIDDSLNVGRFYNNLGINMIYKGIYDSAIYYLKQAQRVKTKLKDPKVGNTINNIGLAYMKMEDYKSALRYYKKAADLKLKYDQKLSLANTYNNIGIIYKKINKLDSAINYYNASLELAIIFDDLAKQSRLYNNLGTLYNTRGDIEKSLAFMEKSIELKRQLKSQNDLLNSLNNYADFLIEQGKLNKAREALKESDAIRDSLGTTMFTINNFLIWSGYYEKTGELQKALEYHKKYHQGKIEQINAEKNDQIAKWETLYETEKKEALIDKMSLKEELNQQELEARKRQIILLTILIIIIVASTVILAIIYHKKKQAEKESHENQIEALKNRLRELHNGNVLHKTEITLEEINEKIHKPLTEREYEVLKGSLEGLTNSAIAEKLHISANTVKYHLKNIYVKLGVDNRKEAYDLLILTD